MKQTKETKKQANQCDKNSTSVRLKKTVKDTLQNEVTLLNKKKKGSKKIDLSDFLALAISLISDDHRAQLLSQTVTAKDRQDAAFVNYLKKHKEATKDDFLELIQYGEVSIEDYLPENMKRIKNSQKSENLAIA
jgi:hypothetical protein